MATECYVVMKKMKIVLTAQQRKKLLDMDPNQSEISRQTGIDQSAISEMLNGKRRPYFDQAAKIAHELGLSLDYLADDRQTRPPVAELSSEERRIIELVRALEVGYEEVARAIYGIKKVAQSGPIGFQAQHVTELKETRPRRRKEPGKNGQSAG